MSKEGNKALLSRFVEELWNRKNMDIVDELVAPGYVDHTPDTSPGLPQGPERFKLLASMFQNAFPDIQVTIEEQIAERGSVVSRLTWRGTHTGQLMGILPSGKQVVITGNYSSHIASGQIVEGWTEFDTLGMLQQVGVSFTKGPIRTADPVQCDPDKPCDSSAGYYCDTSADPAGQTGVCQPMFNW